MLSPSAPLRINSAKHLYHKVSDVRSQQAVIQEVWAQLALYESKDSITIPFRVNLAKALK